MLASLPVRWGGIGVHGLEDLAPSAFLVSAHLARPLISTILPPIAMSSFAFGCPLPLDIHRRRISPQPRFIRNATRLG